uniref:Uncharacterized protein n=1 Tax=Arundo donax TaxID=35708 RepID=A0A0A9CJQ7_ARUDO
MSRGGGARPWISCCSSMRRGKVRAFMISRNSGNFVDLSKFVVNVGVMTIDWHFWVFFSRNHA